MSTIWPIVWKVTSNVETTRTAPSVDYIHKTIPEFIELTIKASMLTPITASLTALPDPDFEVFHYPGIEITTEEITETGDGAGGGGSTSTQTTIEEKPLPPMPENIGIEIIETTDGVDAMVSVDGNSISVNVTDSLHLFPFKRMNYKKDWKEKVKTDFYPWDITEDDYDTISAVEPSGNSMWVGIIYAQVTSTSEYNPKIKLVVAIENDFNYWVETYVQPFMEKSAKFVDDLEEDGEIDDGKSDPPPMVVDNNDYVEITEDLFNEDENGNRIGDSLDDTIRDGGSIEDAIDSLMSTTDDGILIPRITTHKDDLLRTAKTQLLNDGYREPKKIIVDVFNFMVADRDALSMVLDIEGAVRARSIGFASELTRELINNYPISPNKIQSLRVHLSELERGNFSESIDILMDISKNIETNTNYIPNVESIKTKIESGDTEGTIEEITELLDGEPRTFDNLPNPSVANQTQEPPKKINPKRDAKEDLQSWLDNLTRK